MRQASREPRRRPAGDYVITVETPDASTGARLRIRSPRLDLPRQSTGRLLRDETSQIVITDKQLGRALDPASTVGSRPLVLGTDADVDHFLGLVDPLRKLQAVYIVTPQTLKDGTLAMLAASLSIPVWLEGPDDWDQEVLLELVDYYLHSAALRVPIQPLHQMAVATARRGQASFAALFDEQLGRNFYVSQGRATLSPRWAARDLFFGTLEQDVVAFHESPLWKQLEQREHRIFAGKLACSFCPHFPCCRGLWAALPDCEPLCSNWLPVLDRLARTQRNMLKPGGMRG